MQKKRDKFDFWYAINNTEIVSLPSRKLETFGATILNYHVVSELMDCVNQVRVREGRIQSFRPQIVLPNTASFEQAMLEGFGEAAERYIDWLRDHRLELHILQYGFKIKKEEFSEQVLTDNVNAVIERVKEGVSNRKDPFSAVVRGVDDPWEVSLLKLMMEVIRASVPGNVQDLRRRNLFGETDGVPNVVRQEIEDAFLAASRQPALIKRLAALLEKHGLFERYQDRFFALLKAGED